MTKTTRILEIIKKAANDIKDVLQDTNVLTIQVDQKKRQAEFLENYDTYNLAELRIKAQKIRRMNAENNA